MRAISLTCIKQPDSVKKGESKKLIILGTSVFKTFPLSRLQILLMAARPSASTVGESPGYQGFPLMGKISDDYQVHNFL